MDVYEISENRNVQQCISTPLGLIEFIYGMKADVNATVTSVFFSNRLSETGSMCDLHSNLELVTHLAYRVR